LTYPCGVAANEMSRPPVRVLSFNVRYDTDGDGRDAWSNRREAVVGLLRYHRPDVVCLQEPLPHQFEAIRAGLDGHGWFGPDRVSGTAVSSAAVDGSREVEAAGEFVPVGYDRERFERVDAGAFWLSETPDVPGSVGWDADYPRVVSRVTLRERATGDRVHVASVHLDHGGETARAEGASLLRRRLGELDGPLVVAGDFNCGPDSTPYRRMVADRGADAGADTDRADDGAPTLLDAREAATRGHHGPEETFHGFTGEPTERIDHVFVRDCDVSQTATLADRRAEGTVEGGENEIEARERACGRYPSDHFPIVADVRPRRRSGGDAGSVP
jgi:endonuclease/exonuclease/phosphatase family metal-dependent hydrolase